MRGEAQTICNKERTLRNSNTLSVVNIIGPVVFYAVKLKCFRPTRDITFLFHFDEHFSIFRFN